ncbi:MAG: hypothetical protein FWE90_03000 [Defluviitaleaceae bacterium]|nr:hypothetical protein [Defluviitaleaceae bacterium]
MVEKPNMMTIREIAQEGILSEYALRLLLKAGRLPAIYVGKKALINRDLLMEQLTNLQGDVSGRK